MGNVLSSVLGIDRITQKNLIGTWKYKGPGCAFTSENTLAKAGGEIAATQVKERWLRNILNWDSRLQTLTLPLIQWLFLGQTGW